jgi:hypothetical protein
MYKVLKDNILISIHSIYVNIAPDNCFTRLRLCLKAFC